MEEQLTRTVRERLTAYLQAQMPEARNLVITNLQRSPGIGNSRENWPFDAQWEEKGLLVSRRLILRRDPTGSVLETEREPEFRLLKALEGRTPFPVPRVCWLDAKGEWLDRPFIIMERYEGRMDDRNILSNPAIPLETRLTLARRYTEILAQIHSLDWEALGLSFLGVPQGPKGAARAEVEKWEKYASKQALEPQPVLAEALHWLKTHLPEARRIVLNHGDFKPGNSLYRGDQVLVMLDWEMAHLGDPMDDLGWVTMGNYYRENFMPGVWDYKEYYGLYEKLTGFRVDEESVYFYRVLNAFKLAGISLTGARSFCEGRTDRPRFANVGAQNIVANLIGL